VKEADEGTKNRNVPGHSHRISTNIDSVMNNKGHSHHDKETDDDYI
jgi:hypothetical protein